MDQEVRNSLNSKSSEERREFLRRAGKASLGIPATALLLSVTSKRAQAVGYGYHVEQEVVGTEEEDNNWFSMHR